MKPKFCKFFVVGSDTSTNELSVLSRCFTRNQALFSLRFLTSLNSGEFPRFVDLRICSIKDLNDLDLLPF